MWRRDRSCGGRGLLLHRLCRSCVTKRTRSLIYHWRGERNIYACLMLDTPWVNSFKSRRRSVISPRRPPGLPTSHKVLQKGEFKGWRIIRVFHCHLDWLDRMGNEHKESGAEETVAAGGLGPVYPACTGLTPLSFHCCWFGTNPSNFLQRQDKMCLPYLYIYSTSHIPLFTLPFFSALACKWGSARSR